MMMGVEDALCIEVTITLVERERGLSGGGVGVGWEGPQSLKPHLAHSRMRLSAAFARDPCNQDGRI